MIEGFEQFVALFGPPVTQETVIQGLPTDWLKQALGAARFLEILLNHAEQSGPPIQIALVNSTGLTCSIRRTPESVLIVLPIGAVARVALTSRVLLCYWNEENLVQFVNSPLDDIDEHDWEVPPLLAPIFGP